MGAVDEARQDPGRHTDQDAPWVDRAAVDFRISDRIREQGRLVDLAERVRREALRAFRPES